VLYDGLNNLDSPNFFLGVNVEGMLTEQPPAGPIRARLEQELARLDPDQIAAVQASGGALEAVPHWRFRVGGCTLDFFPIAKTDSARGKPGDRPLGMQGDEAHWIDPRRPLRDAIVAKGQHLSGIDYPLIVAVNALDWSVGRGDVMEALFGKNQISVQALAFGSGEPTYTRAADGALTSPGGPRYTRISAVFMAHRVMPWSLAAAELCLYHNPFAERPLTADMRSLTQATPSGTEMTWTEGERLASLLGLPPAWPEQER
jgi:hypothetical protein